MSAWSIAVKALIAILVLVMAWRTDRKKKEKWLLTVIVILWSVSAALDIAQDRRSAHEQAAIRGEQHRMADALGVLKTNSEHEEADKQAEKQRRDNIVKQLTALLNEGIRARNECQQPQSKSDLEWTHKVESQLHNINSSDEAAFKSAEAPLICYQSMDIKMGALQRIIDRYN
jgi:uncharacterized membrane protein YgaE (UPF0421/DUF939 family)